MRIRVLYFQVLRHKIGTSEEWLEAPEGTTVSDAVGLLAARHPVLDAVRASLLAAVNEEWVPDETPLRDGETLALMPPVSGG
jgi:molybdopterin synthase catalytic subunit